tara:strand:- start:148 stop:600 length:453 start_codon:yes stop_codon:yes gene_type:complete
MGDRPQGVAGDCNSLSTKRIKSQTKANNRPRDYSQTASDLLNQRRNYRMTLTITQNEINTLWDKGYRPFEIYLCNDEPEMYCGKMEEAGSIGGWDIKHIFATRDEIENYPNFDCIINIDSVAYCTEVFHGKNEDTPADQVENFLFGGVQS